MQQGAEYANSVETLTLCALRVLHMLVCACEEVRSLCVRSRAGVTPQLQPATDTSSSSIGTDHERDKVIYNSLFDVGGDGGGGGGDAGRVGGVVC